MLQRAESAGSSGAQVATERTAKRPGRPERPERPERIAPAEDAATRASVRRWLLVLVGAYVLVSLLCLRVAPVANRAEDRCAEVVATMVTTGDWLVPRYGGAVRLQKPPLAYWTGAAVSELMGQASLVALRLPSVVAAVALLFVTFAWGRRVGGARLGLASAACLVTMELFIAYGRRGVAEMQLALYTSLALLLFDVLLERPRPGLRAGFGVALGLALLAKATAGLMIVLVPIAVTLSLRHRWRSALRLRNLAWLGVAVAIGLSWYAAILAAVPGGWRMLEAELLLPLGVGADPDLVASGGSAAAHYNGIGFHFNSLLTGATPVLAALLWWAVRRAGSSGAWREQPRARFVFVVFASLFVAFTLLPQKQKHYMLPLLPSLAILLAEGALDRARRDPPAFARVVRRLGYAAATLVVVVLGVAAVRETRIGQGLPSALLLAAAGLGLGAVLAVAARRGRPVHVGGASVAATLVIMLLYGLVFEAREPPRAWRLPAPGSAVPPASEPAR